AVALKPYNLRQTAAVPIASAIEHCEAFCSALAARSSASSGRSKARILSSDSVTPLSMASTPSLSANSPHQIKSYSLPTLWPATHQNNLFDARDLARRIAADVARRPELVGKA